MNTPLSLAARIGQRSAQERAGLAHERLQLAQQRDEAADARDLAAQARDRAADERDLATSEPYLLRRKRPERSSDSYRLLAAEDRRAASADRALAALERREALADRQALAQELEQAEIDPLTGARTRAAGLRDLDRELDRAGRSSSPLAVAYVDVVGLKAINDTLGHAAGDALLQRVVAHVKAHVRPYDLLIRLGGDEFLCAMSDLTAEDAKDRFRVITSAIARCAEAGQIRTGFAQLGPGESADQLIARADQELLGRPGSRLTLNGANHR